MQPADSADSSRAADLRRSVFDHVRREFVPLDILARHARALHPDFTALWLFRRAFTTHLAAAALATYVLGLNKSSPHAVKIVASSGALVPWELAFSLDSAGLLVPSDRVPFRLTPTLVNFASPVGVSGIFSGCLVSGAAALSDPDMPLGDHVAIILRDEILSWSLNAGPGGRALDGDALASKIKQNVENMGRRLASICSSDAGAGPPGTPGGVAGSISGVELLIKNATATGNLCLMSPMWHPWL